LQRRYEQLIVAHLSESQRVAAGLHPPPADTSPFAAVQAAWRFYANDRIDLPQLAGPLIAWARGGAAIQADQWLLNVLDWSPLHFNRHRGKADRVELAHSKDLGYDLLTALVVSDRDGSPIAPVCLEVEAADGVHSTRSAKPLASVSRLDGLTPVIDYVEGLGLGRRLVHVIDREADSVGHFRRWQADGRYFLVRVDDDRLVLHEGRECRLGALAKQIADHGQLIQTGPVQFKGRQACQWVGETMVVLHRPACQHRMGKKGKACHVMVSGPPITLRVVVSEIRDEHGRLLGRWLLLTNLPAEVSAATAALWYYWRWRIETYHKLLKGAGQEVEYWQQETAEALTRRLTVAAMAGVVVWHLARDERPEAAQLRDVLVALSGRQMKRGPKARSFTEPALLVGLGVLIPMLALLEHYDLPTLRDIATSALPLIRSVLPLRSESG
jgi:hypothetical protein